MTATIRAAGAEDLPTLCAIYDPYVRETAITFDLEPPTLRERQRWFEERFVEGNEVFLAVELEGRVIGFGWSSPFRPKAAYARSAELSIYLANDRLGAGHGSALLSALLDEVRARGRRRALGGVALPNPASRAMLQRHGFTPVGVFEEVGEKLGRLWDVEWFSRAL
jgi:phosphinothricin acetyltransferase